MAVNSLGAFDFISLQGPDRGMTPDVPQMESAVVQRPGVDGSGLILLGTKGQPIQLRSVRDVADIATGNALAVSYKTASRSSAWTLVFQSIDYAAIFNTKYFVLRVDQVSVMRIRGAVGGVMGSGAGAIVTAVWTLLPVAVPAS